MPVSRSRKKKKKKSPSRKKEGIVPYEAVKHKLVEVESPFPDDLPFDERLKVFLDIAERANQGFEEDFQKTTEYLKEYDPLYLISFCAYYFVSSLEGVDKEAIDGGLEFHPFYIEVLQCMALFHEREISAAPLLERAEDFKETLQRLNTNQTFRYY